MTLAAAGRVRMDMCSSLVCLDENNGYHLSGRVYNTYFNKPNEKGWKGAFGKKEGKHFRSMLELIEILEELYDQLDYPQSSVKFRTLTEKKLKIKHKTAEKRSKEFGKLATFTLRIMFRQNASWQGTVRWIEQNKTENFRSVLELIHLMDSMKVIRDHDESTTDSGQKMKLRQII